MSSSFLAACSLRAADAAELEAPASAPAAPPLVERQSSTVFRELSEHIVMHLPLADLALTALKISRAFSAAARSRLGLLMPKLMPLVAAPFALQPCELLHSTSLILSRRSLGANGVPYAHFAMLSPAGHCGLSRTFISESTTSAMPG